jgi:thiosulfate reductase cytochrome b subunit
MSERITATKQKKTPAWTGRMYERFHWTQRIAHALLLTSFSLLGITGLPQKFATTGWAQAMIQFLGGIETTRLIHHICAILLMLLAIYHLLDAGYNIRQTHTVKYAAGCSGCEGCLTSVYIQLGFHKEATTNGSLHLRGKG